MGEPALPNARRKPRALDTHQADDEILTRFFVASRCWCDGFDNLAIKKLARPAQSGRAMRAVSLIAAVFFAACAHLAAAQSEYENLFNGGGQACPRYQCPSQGLVPVGRTNQYFSSGCGGMSNSFSMMRGQGRSTYKALEPCCNVRSACFSVCGSSSQACNKAFKACATKACTGLDGEEETECKTSKNLLQISLSFGGCDDFNAKQKEACKCVQEDRVERRHRSELEAFYKKHNPDKVSSAAKLAKAIQSPAKWAKLMTKLLAKYPTAVTIRKSQSQILFEDLQRRANSGEFEEVGVSDENTDGGNTDADADDAEETVDLDDVNEPRSEL